MSTLDLDAIRAVGRWAKAWRERRKERIEERTDRDEIVQHVATVRALPIDRKAIPNRRKRKVVSA